MKTLRVAVQGCGHGELDSIYARLKNEAVDLLIITGDFQAIRNLTDLNTISVPAKYKQLGQFHRYYTKEKRAPIPTIFVGGNHECSSYLKELKYGGWVAPNIYFLGEFGAIWYRGLRVCGVSGIYNRSSFIYNHTNLEDPKLPYDSTTLRSVYHMTSKNYLKLMLMKADQPLDVVVSHDWPQYIYHHGNLDQLLKQKPFFREDVESGRLGNPLMRYALNELSPRYWFSSHLHVKFEANVSREGIKVPGDNEIDLDMDMDLAANEDEHNDSDAEGITRFLALDKCGRSRKHLQVEQIRVDQNHISYGTKDFYYDTKAVAINKVMEEYVRTDQWSTVKPVKLLDSPPELDHLQELVDNEIQAISRDPNLLIIPKNFELVAPGGHVSPPLQYWPNGQTKEYCTKFHIPQTI